MPKQGNFRTKREAENHAAKLRNRFPRMKPIRVVKASVGWDVIVSH